MCAFTRESARSVTGGGRCREGRGGDRSVRSSFEQGGLRIRIVRRVRESRACAFSREELAVSRYNIYTNERAQNRESFTAVSIDELTNERTKQRARERRRRRLRRGFARLSRCYHRGSPRIEGIRARWRSRPVERSRSRLRRGTRARPKEQPKDWSRSGAGRGRRGGRETVVARVTARDGQEGFQAEDPMENSEHRWWVISRLYPLLLFLLSRSSRRRLVPRVTFSSRAKNNSMRDVKCTAGHRSTSARDVGAKKREIEREERRGHFALSRGAGLLRPSRLSICPFCLYSRTFPLLKIKRVVLPSLRREER